MKKRKKIIKNYWQKSNFDMNFVYMSKKRGVLYEIKD